jgi:hypothetical protein
VILAITGGRRDPITRRVLSALPVPILLAFARLIDQLSPSIVCHGDALGTDRIIDTWLHANRPNIIVRRFRVNTTIDGEWPNAGNRRNRRMLVDSRAGGLIAFPGGSGTADCTSQAMVMGLRVWEWQQQAGDFVEITIS